MILGARDVMRLRPAKRLRGVADRAPIDSGFGEWDRATGFRDPPGLPAQDLLRLDTMLDQHGLKAILAALVKGCYQRSHDSGGEEDFSDFEDLEKWRQAAQVVECAVINDKVNIK